MANAEQLEIGSSGRSRFCSPSRGAVITGGQLSQNAGIDGLQEPSSAAAGDLDPHRCGAKHKAGRLHFQRSTSMMHKIGARLIAVANVGLPFAAMALIAGPAYAFSAPAQGDLGYDIYDIVVNKGVKGPLGFVGGVAAFLFGVSRLFSNIMIGIPTIVAAVCLIKADSILQTFGMTI